MAIRINNADKKFRNWYERGSGKKISELEFEEMKQNTLGFFHILERWNRTSQRDLNSELYENRLVDE